MTNVNFMTFFGTSPLATMPPMGGAGGFGATGSTGANSMLSQLLLGLSQALQGLAGLIGGNGGSPVNTLPFPGQPSAPGAGGSPDVSGAKPIAGTARIWGDPHFIGADGGTFDVQGEAGKTYNLLSDKGFQMNGRFDKWGSSGGATVVGEVGITAGSNYVNVDKTGKAIVNGQVLRDGDRVALRDGGYVEKKGNNITVKKGEWQVDFQAHGDHINMDIKTDNAIADGVKPHGLIGQTFDGDGKARNGDKGTGVQGGGAIEDVNGDITKGGDKNAVKSYEVDSLWSTAFRHHNRDYAQQSVYHDAARDSMAFLAMTGFSALFSSMFGDSGSFGWGKTPNHIF